MDPRISKIVEIFALVLIAIIGLYLLEKNPIVFDLTKNQRYSPDKKIIELLNKLDDNVYVKVFYDKGIGEYSKVEEVLRNLSRYSPKVKYSFLDPRKDVVKAQLYGFSSSNQILIIYKNRKKFENTIDNEKFANVVANLLRQKEGKILFTIGHKELSIDNSANDGLSILVSSLKEEGLKVETINLAAVEESNSIETHKPLALFVVGPKIDFTEEELQKVKDYLYDGGKLVFALKSYNKSKFKNLEKLFKEYGIDVKEDFILGMDPSNVAIVLANVVNLPYLASLYNVNFYLLNPNIVERYKEVKDVSLSEVLTAKGIKVTQEMMKKEKIIISRDSLNDYTVGIMAEKIIKDKKANLLVIGDYGMFMNGLINAGENINFVLAIIDYFSDTQSNFVFKPKDIPDLPILIPLYQQVLLYIVILGFPLLFLFSYFLFIRRRKVQS